MENAFGTMELTELNDQELAGIDGGLWFRAFFYSCKFTEWYDIARVAVVDGWNGTHNPPQ